MTLNGRTALYCANNAFFGAHHGYWKEDRPILSAAKMYPRDSTFRRYKVRADNRGGSPERGRQTNVKKREVFPEPQGP